MKKAKVTILGCGNSSGVPAAGNYWGVCDPSEPKNVRSRCSAYIDSPDGKVIIDTGPDLRDQTNRENISHIDAVLYTHMHGDHTSGIDDLRPFYFRKGHLPIEIFGSQQTLEDMEKRFPYIFSGGVDLSLYPPFLAPNEIQMEEGGYVFNPCGLLEVTAFPMDHGTCVSTGFRIGNFAYCTDFLKLSSEALEIIKECEIIVFDAAGYKNQKNKVHAHLDRLYEYQKKLTAERIYLTSLSVEMDYALLLNELPTPFLPAYDGVSFEITY